MDSAKLNDWLQVVGMFAVVASLIFVGMQTTTLLCPESIRQELR
jgi:hypothetical protein